MAKPVLTLKRPLRDYEAIKQQAVLNKLERDREAYAAMNATQRNYHGQKQKLGAELRALDRRAYRKHQTTYSAWRSFAASNGLSLQTGPLSLGDRSIAEHLRPVFIEMAKMSPRDIAIVMNHRGIPTPKGLQWDGANVTKVKAQLGMKLEAHLVEPLPVSAGQCKYCGEAIDPEKRPDSQFCNDSHSKAYRRRAVKIDAANRVFKDYVQSEQAKADAMASLKLYRVAAQEMQDSAARCGVEDISFVGTAGGVVAIHDTTLPPVRLRLSWQTESTGQFLHPVSLPVAVDVAERNLTTTHPDVVALLPSFDGPERRAAIFTFELPERQPEYVGMPEMDIRFKGDPGLFDYDSFDPPSKPDDETYRRPDLCEKNYRVNGSNKPTWDYSHRLHDKHKAERLANLLARADHDAIVKDLRDAGRFTEASDLILAGRRQDLLKGVVRDNPSQKI